MALYDQANIDNLCETLDLGGVIQMTMISALEESAAANGCTMKYDRGNDGWYKYRGFIDTYLISEAIEVAVKTKVAKTKPRIRVKANSISV